MVIYHFDTILFVAKIGCPQDHADSGRSPATDEVVDTVHGHVSSHYADQEMALQLEYQTKKLKVVIGGIERSIKIVTKLHDGKNDEVGEVIVDEKEDEKIIKKKIEDTTEMVGGSEFPVRTYTVDPDLLISVTVKFPTPTGMSEEEIAAEVNRLMNPQHQQQQNTQSHPHPVQVESVLAGLHSP
jgi:hypothetical protein